MEELSTRTVNNLLTTRTQQTSQATLRIIMICKAPAKINIGLDIIERLPNGFHALESVFYPLPFYDLLEIIESPTFQLINTGIEVNCPTEENLLYKAWKKLKEQYNIPAVKIHLHKQIPFGAGLGGGSSDATSLLMGLNELFQLNLTQCQLHEIAATLGSDCPFFLHKKPMLTKGTGDIFEASPIDLTSMHYSLFYPEISISTPWAYKQIKPDSTRQSLLQRLKQPINLWKDLITNDFEPPVFDKCPEIASLKTDLYTQGATYASLSGSGSAVFALHNKPLRLNKQQQKWLYSQGKL